MPTKPNKGETEDLKSVTINTQDTENQKTGINKFSENKKKRDTWEDSEGNSSLLIGKV